MNSIYVRDNFLYTISIASHISEPKKNRILKYCADVLGSIVYGVGRQNIEILSSSHVISSIILSEHTDNFPKILG